MTWQAPIVILLLVTAGVSSGCWRSEDQGDDESSGEASDLGDSDSDVDGDGDSDSDTDTDADVPPESCDDGVWDGTFIVASPADIATLAGCTEITGKLKIDCSACSSLGELFELQSIGGSLEIGNNGALETELVGLGGVTTIGGNLTVVYNPSLESLAGLDGLVTIGGRLTIEGNLALHSLDGIDSLLSIGENLLVDNNPELFECEVCALIEQLTSPPGYVNVFANLDDDCTPVPDNCP